MIYRIFFIFDSINVPGDQPSPEENVYYSVLAASPLKASLDTIYHLAVSGHFSRNIVLTLDLRHPLTDKDLESITSFLFLPSYLRVEDRPVINLSADSTTLLKDSAAAITGYLAQQGIEAPLLCFIAGEVAEPEECILLQSLDTLNQDYRQLLEKDPCSDRNVFFFASSNGISQSALSALKQAEFDFSQTRPHLYALMQARQSLQKELGSVRRNYRAALTELSHQQEYNEILRSGHQTKQIQDYYTREYEILPLWYKRLGHIVKVLAGKRTFRSLFRDDVKKYKV